MKKRRLMLQITLNDVLTGGGRNNGFITVGVF